MVLRMQSLAMSAAKSPQFRIKVIGFASPNLENEGSFTSRYGLLDRNIPYRDPGSTLRTVMMSFNRQSC